MSNRLSIRRVIVQTIDAYGNLEGEPTYGIMAADNYTQTYDDTFDSLADLNEFIKESGNILNAIDPDGSIFEYSQPERVGFYNFYGGY